MSSKKENAELRVYKTRTSVSMKSLAVAGVTNLSIQFDNATVGIRQKLPNITRLEITLYGKRIPKPWTKIGDWAPNVTTFEFNGTTRGGVFQRSLVKKIPSLRHFIFNTDQDWYNEQSVVGFVNANPQLTRLTMTWSCEDVGDVQGKIKWKKMKDLAELKMDGVYLTESRIADSKQIRKIWIMGIEGDIKDLDYFVLEHLEEFTSTEIDDNVINVIMKHRNLKKLDIPYAGHARFIELPKYLPELTELRILGISYHLEKDPVAANAIMEFMQTCGQLNSIVLSHWDEPNSTERLELIQSQINQKFGQGKWDCVQRSFGLYNHILCIEKKQ